MTIQDEKIAAAGLSVLDAARFAGVGRSTIYEELAAGRLRAVKVGRRTIIPQPALVDWRLDGRSPGLPLALDLEQGKPQREVSTPGATTMIQVSSSTEAAPHHNKGSVSAGSGDRAPDPRLLAPAWSNPTT